MLEVGGNKFTEAQTVPMTQIDSDFVFSKV